MRLRNLRKLEEMEIRGERNDLLKEGADLTDLLQNEKKRWKTIKDQVREIKKQFGDDKVLGPRRTAFGKAPAAVADALLESMVEREPITVLLSEQGWIRTLKGHPENTADQKYKEGDAEGYVIRGETTDKFILFASDGRFFTLSGDKLPGGRGFGDPVKLMVSMGDNAEIVSFFKYDENAKVVVGASDGRGFIVPVKDVLAQTKNGKAVLTVPSDVRATVCVPVDPKATHIGVIGTNSKLVIFPISQVPEMSKGRGVTLQKYKEGELNDILTFVLADGIKWSKGRTSARDLKVWIVERGQAGRLAPFPRSKKFE